MRWCAEQFALSRAQKTADLIIQKLLTCKEAVEKHFDVTLNECEEPQFLRYRVGDFFVAHQDGNTGLMLLDSEKRRISTVIFLSRESESPEPDAYCGGSLVFSNLRHQLSHDGRARDARSFSLGNHSRSHAGHTRRTLFDCLVVQVTMHAQHPKQGDKRSLATHAHEENRQSHAAAC